MAVIRGREYRSSAAGSTSRRRGAWAGRRSRAQGLPGASSGQAYSAAPSGATTLDLSDWPFEHRYFREQTGWGATVTNTGGLAPVRVRSARADTCSVEQNSPVKETDAHLSPARRYPSSPERRRNENQGDRDRLPVLGCFCR